MTDKIYVVPNLVDQPAWGCLYTSYVPPGRVRYIWVTSPSIYHESGRWGVPIYTPSGVRSLVPEIVIEPFAHFHSSNDFQVGCWSENSLVLTPSVLVIMVGIMVSPSQDTISPIECTFFQWWNQFISIISSVVKILVAWMASING